MEQENQESPDWVERITCEHDMMILIIKKNKVLTKVTNG